MKRNIVSSNNFFLLSFLPAIAYWYLEANYSFKIAILGGLAIAITEMLLEFKFTGHLHQMSKFNFYLILFLGVISFLGEEGFWFKLQPCITGVVIGVYLFWKLKFGTGLFFEMILSFNKVPPPKEIVNKMELHSAFLFFGYGIFMGGVAYFASTERWLFFKTIGFYIVFAIFMILEFFLIRLSIKKMISNQRKLEVLNKFKN